MAKHCISDATYETLKLRAKPFETLDQLILRLAAAGQAPVVAEPAIRAVDLTNAKISQISGHYTASNTTFSAVSLFFVEDFLKARGRDALLALNIPGIKLGAPEKKHHRYIKAYDLCLGYRALPLVGVGIQKICRAGDYAVNIVGYWNNQPREYFNLKYP